MNRLPDPILIHHLFRYLTEDDYENLEEVDERCRTIIGGLRCYWCNDVDLKLRKCGACKNRYCRECQGERYENVCKYCYEEKCHQCWDEEPIVECRACLKRVCGQCTFYAWCQCGEGYCWKCKEKGLVDVETLCVKCNKFFSDYEHINHYIIGDDGAYYCKECS